MALKLTLKSPVGVPWESRFLRPDLLSKISGIEIAESPVQIGNRTECLGDLFAIEGDGSDGQLMIEGDLSHGRGIGQGMESGALTIIGNAGHRLGAEMTGGDIEVRGSVAASAGAEMREGRIWIRGNAGINLGGAFPGSRSGMRGGLIVADGEVGADAGLLMRRGLIAIAGSTGENLGHAMIAGSIFVLGTPGPRVGAFMKRGTLVFLGPRPEISPTFRPSVRYRPPFLTIYLKELRRLSFNVPNEAFAKEKEMDQFRGDLAEGGQGEILTFAV